MNPPEMLLLDELSPPKQDELAEFIRYFRTALNAHKIYPMGHKMIVQSVHRLLKLVRRLMGQGEHFVLNLFEDRLEYNGERYKRRGQEAEYSKEIAGMFKDHRLQTLVFLPLTNNRDVSALFSLLVTHDVEEEGALELASMQSRFPTMWVNTTVVRRTVGDKVREAQMPDYQSSTDLPATQDPLSYDPDEVIANLPPEVRSGAFFLQLMHEMPSNDAWPTPHLGIGEASDSGPIPLQSTGEFSSFSMPGLDGVNPGLASQAELDARAPFSDDGIGGELLLEMEDDSPMASSPSLPGLPPVGDISTLPPDLQERFHQEMLRQLDAMVPQMLTQYMQQLAGDDPEKSAMRQSILAQLAPEKIEATQLELVSQMEKASARDEMVNAVTLFQDMVDQQLEKGILEGVSRALEELEGRQHDNARSKGLEVGTARVLAHLQQEDKLQQLIEHGVEVQRSDARVLLSQLAPSSLPQCIKALTSAQDREERRRLSELLIELSRKATPEKREAGFSALIDHLNDFGDDEKEREFFLELVRNYSPIQFETYIIQHLSDSTETGERALLLRQAIAHDSPKLRGLLTRLFENRIFGHQPDQEELLLRYLQRRESLDIVDVLTQEIDNPRQDPGLRNSAVWLLGALETPNALKMLQQVLERLDHAKRPFYPEELRFQALHALARLPRAEVEGVIRIARRDESMLVQAQAAHLLHEPVTLSTLADFDKGSPSKPAAQSPPSEPVTSIDTNSGFAEVEDTLVDDEEPLITASFLDRFFMADFWTRPRLILAISLAVVLLLALGWGLGKLFG